MILVRDVSRAGVPGGVRLTWEDETGWAYAKPGSGIHGHLPAATSTGGESATEPLAEQTMGLCWYG
ncbi:hypothetical protein [Streptomyces sp. QTS137]